MFSPLVRLILAAVMLSTAHAVSVSAGITGNKDAKAPLMPHILFILADDFGHADAGWHRNGSDPEVVTPNMDALVAQGINLNRHYAFKYCSPSRSALQSGRNPVHVNDVNKPIGIHNKNDLMSGFAGIPRNMTGMAELMRAAGYKTTFSGKWDAGMALAEQTPHGRGYDSSLLYFSHCVDYWTATPSNGCMDPKVNRTVGVVDMFDGTGPLHFNGSAVCGMPSEPFGECDCSSCALCKGTGTKFLRGPFNGSDYIDDLFHARIRKAILDHQPGDKLFMVWASHIVHTPLQVPQAALDKFMHIGNPSRRIYHAMVYYLDTMIGDVVALLQAKGLFQDTLIVFSSDNGGPIYGAHAGWAGANNYPLRGGKFSNWEGGIRVNSFVSGGAIPETRRGTTENSLVTLWDWYATFAHLAGQDPHDHKAEAAGLPPIDSINQWPLLSGENTTAPRTEIPVGNGAGGVAGIVTPQYKLLRGNIAYSVWQGPRFPNETSVNNVLVQHHCSVGNKKACLFDVVADPTEHDDIADQHPELVSTLLAAVEHHAAGVFNPNRGTDDGTACRVALDRYGGTFGPFLE
eukprot:m.486761 g.486761  ORF g.486761 m.486761 type:complete len:573 (-) comp24586_c0_seq1:69-1787(-)